MSKHQVYSLVSLDISSLTEERRNIIGLADFQADPDLVHLDDTTLFYDCVVSPDQRSLRFAAPLFENLWRLFADSIRINGKPVQKLNRVTLPRTRAPRCDLVDVDWRQGDQLSFEIEGQNIPIAPRASAAKAFKKTNALLTLSKDNDLEWIRDWALFHANAHGANSVVFFDNGSTRYSEEDIRDCLAQVPGIEASAVIRTPFKYGRKLKAEGKSVNLFFLQIAMLNLARRDFLASSNAALNIDIDEMIIRGKRSVFDVTKWSLLGAATIPGKWTYPKAGEEPPLPHRKNLFHPENSKCQNKWCARPNGFLSREGWDVHNVGAKLNYFNSRTTNSCWLAHCAATTTSWKPKGKTKRYRENVEQTLNPELKRQWELYLPE